MAAEYQLSRYTKALKHKKEGELLMKSRKVQIVNPSGLHLRPAGVLCQASMKYKSEINILYKDKVINAKSVLNVMASGIKCGTEVEVQCSAEDEAEALDTVCALIETGLKE